METDKEENELIEELGNILYNDKTVTLKRVKRGKEVEKTIKLKGMHQQGNNNYTLSTDNALIEWARYKQEMLGHLDCDLINLEVDVQDELNEEKQVEAKNIMPDKSRVT